MHGRHPHFQPRGGGRGEPPPPMPQAPPQNLNPNVYFQNPNLFIHNPFFVRMNQFPQNPNILFQNPNGAIPTTNFNPIQVPIQPSQSHPVRPKEERERSDRAGPKTRSGIPTSNTVPTSTTNSSPNQVSNQRSQSQPVRPEDRDRIDRAVAKARSDLLAAGECVSAWEVSQLALIDLKAESWDSLGLQMQQVPSLNRLIITERKINAYIHSFVAVRRITSLHDLEVAICKTEGVERYEELELGPLVRHPLVMHYFCVGSDIKDIFEITSEEIICYLCEFIDSHKSRRIDVEEFLDFVAKKKSLSGREKLNVRIKSLGLHSSFIRQARRLENNTLKKCLEDLKQNSNRRLRKRPLLSKQKKQLDDHFNSIAQRIESFSSLHKDFGGKHIRFVSSSSEENDSEEYEDQVNKNDEDIQSHCNISQNTVSSNRASGCPYPSAAEEMSRLGLKVEISIDPSPANDSLRCKKSHGLSKRKRKSENLSNVTEPCKVPKTDKHGSDVTKEDREFISHDEASQFEADLSLDNNSMRMFIMMWKDACRVNSVAEIFRRMLQFYKPPRRIRARAVFSTYPFIGLLHVAVISIKRGMWDSMYDDLQGFAHPSVADTLSENCSVYESIEIEPAEKNTLTTIEHDLKCVTLDDIVQKVSSYFELDHNILSNVELSFENKLIFLRKLCKCEIWLTKQFSVEKFESLGFGEFFMFLKNHVCQLYCALQECLAGKAFKKSSFDVCMLEQQLALLLSQAAISRGGDEIITEEMISQLLMRQFPLVSFVLPERGSLKDFMDDFEKKESISTCVLFSATLLGRQSGNTGSVKESLGTGVMETKKGYETKTFASFTTKDAIGVLLQAPLLSDLFSWTHWDIVFAPSLGPLVGWLLNEVNTKELLCLVTKDGKVIRIDHTASVDSFFEACLQGSSFQTAVKLLSLLSLYGGEAHVPLSLLKCHARQAFEVFMKNSVEVEINKNQATTIYSPYKDILDRDTSSFSFDLLRSNSTNRKEVYVASRFFINCLGHLPREFCAFAADVLLSGIQLIVKDAPSAILGECKDIGQRLLLHDVGLSLGIVEWIDDYHLFRSSTTNGALISFGMPCLGAISPDSGGGSTQTQDESSKLPSSEGKMLVSIELDPHNKEFERASDVLNDDEVSGGGSYDCCIKDLSENDKENEALMVIESIRREEFGLDPRISDMEVSMLKKQHARLGRALHCLSQELYSQDSHFLLELVQNADDNLYPENVEPTLTFILQESGIVVLNNERGFSAQNIRALCDVGSSTKKGATGGYIGKKGIGFKSVFRVTDAPEIHSNGFHVKFDITEGQIGFVLPTVVPRCDVDSYRRLASLNIDKTDAFCWNTSIVLPFRTKLSEDSSMNSIRLMFSDLHPSLLLFLHRLQCIRFRNIPDDTMVIMKKEIVGNGIVNVAFGKEKMTWFVASQVLQANVIRPDVHTTEISIAFPLQESGNGEYVPRLEQQPVFAFLPLRKYGLKFILQGDFVLPSSREEVDGDSPWNQWLLEKFPDLFVSAEKSFCAFPCFRDNPGKAVSLFMGFVPLVGEVQGFFSSLPRLIISKLRSSKCLLMEGDREGWVLPCKVIRNWNDEAQNLLSNSYLHEHLGLRFLDRNIVLSDLLSRDLGIQEYGPSILVQLMASLCYSDKGIKSAGPVWLSSWLNALYTMLFNSSGQISLCSGTASDVINNLKKIPFVPLSDGSYSSVDEGTIWLHLDSFCPGSANDHYSDAFPILYAKLRTVSPALFSAAATVDISGLGMSIQDNVTRMLLRIGVQQLSAHEIVKVHILPAISDVRITLDDKIMMVEYLSFIMFHLQSSCPTCHVERGHIISELRDKALILTNYGYKRPTEVTMHFSKQFGNPVDISKLIHGMDLKWHDVEVEYLQHPITGALPSSMRQWREFFQQIGVMDFVHVVSVEKSITDISAAALKNMLWDGDRIPHGAVAKDWESSELVHLLSQLSLSSDRVRSQYLLEALDILWDDCFSDKVAGYCINNSLGDGRAFKSSFMSCLCGIRWVASSIDEELHYSKDLFYDCEAVRSVLGATAPYAVPKVKSEKLLSDIGLKTQVILDDVLTALQVWRRSETPFMASITQMSKFYTFIWNEMAVSKHKIVDILNMGPFIFIPYSCVSRHEDLVLGGLFSPSEVHWHDFTGSVQQIEEIHHRHGSGAIDHPLCKSLCNIYPSLHAFFVNECGVKEIPHYRSYLQILLELSTVTLPSQTAKTVFQVFLQWSDGLKSGLLCSEDVIYLKGCLLKLEFTVLPTLLDKWVSLHPSFGLVCWCDDEKLKKEFKHLDKIEFLYFGELSDEEQEFLRSKVSFLMKTLGIPTLSDVITREAICYGLADCSFKISLLNWALPYAQRYIYNTHRDRYFELKESGFQVLSQLRIAVVEKLFYRNIIEGANIASKKRFECNCLLQRNVLYATQETDSHSLFMELSRLLSDGTPDLHLANFLHMITTMAESGSNEEQTEFFILNSQKIPKLPDNESIWSLPSTPSSSDYEALPITNDLTNSNEQNSTIYKRKPGISSNWPPVDWKTAPGFTYAYANGLNMQSNVSPPDSVMQVRKLDTPDIRTAKTDHEVPAEINANCAIECDPTAITAIVVLPDSQASEDQENMVDSVDLDTQCEGPKSEAFFPSGRDQHSHTAPNPQHVLTGRLGELVAFNYFSSNAVTGCVTWVNQDTETGLPYDLVIEDERKRVEYIEVKATRSSMKDWFHITLREWQYAVEKGDSFSIAHVILSANNVARINVFKNPARLCQLRKLHLAVVMPKSLQEFSITS